MMLIRRFEEKSAEMYARGRIAGFLHLYIGQEATGVGAIAAVAPTTTSSATTATTARRSPAASTRKPSWRSCSAATTGVSKGRGGSMHLFDVSRHFMGGYAIVGGHLPIACGLAFANKHLKNNRIVLCVFGDGAVNQGEFHESLNLAAVWRLPVVFLCENNLYGMGTDISRVSAETRGLSAGLRLQHPGRAGRRHGRAGRPRRGPKGGRSTRAKAKGRTSSNR